MEENRQEERAEDNKKWEMILEQFQKFSIEEIKICGKKLSKLWCNLRRYRGIGMLKD